MDNVWFNNIDLSIKIDSSNNELVISLKGNGPIKANFCLVIEFSDTEPLIIDGCNRLCQASIPAERTDFINGVTIKRKAK